MLPVQADRMIHSHSDILTDTLGPNDGPSDAPSRSSGRMDGGPIRLRLGDFIYIFILIINTTPALSDAGFSTLNEVAANTISAFLAIKGADVHVSSVSRKQHILSSYTSVMISVTIPPYEVPVLYQQNYTLYKLYFDGQLMDWVDSSVIATALNGQLPEEVVVDNVAFLTSTIEAPSASPSAAPTPLPINSTNVHITIEGNVPLLTFLGSVGYVVFASVMAVMVSYCTYECYFKESRKAVNLGLASLESDESEKTRPLGFEVASASIGVSADFTIDTIHDTDYHSDFTHDTLHDTDEFAHDTAEFTHHTLHDTTIHT